jgi:hypothetical protein
MNISSKVGDLILKHEKDNVVDAKYLVMDDESYFTLKEELYGSVEAAIIAEIEDYCGLKVFHNNLGYTFIDVA